MITRLTAVVRPVPLAAAACAVLAVAGCSSGGASGSPSASKPAASHNSSSGGTSASDALARAAAAARQVTTFTASLDISSSGTYASHMTGTLAEQTKPTVLAEQKFNVTGAGAPAQRMQTVLTDKAVYLRLSSLAKLTGKPWVVFPFSALKKSVGASFGPLIRELQSNNPLAMAQLLPASANVREIGSATVNGIPTTEYAGTYSVAAALAKLGAGFRKTLEPTLKASGLKTASFHVWVDGQGQIRKLVEHEGGGDYQVDSTVVITSINQPVRISAPPASQVATFPGI